MNIIKIGEPIITKLGTVVSRYVENGKMYKLIDFSKSANKVAKEKKLVKTLVTYGEGNKPAKIYDTFEHSLTKKPTVQNPSKPQTQVISSNAEQNKTMLDAYKANKKSVLYKSYESYVADVKKDLKKYKDIIPKELYDDIMKRYGTEEKSIIQILKDNSVDLSSISTTNAVGVKRYFGRFISSIEKKEKEFAQIRLADLGTKRSVVLTNAWTSSGLRRDLGNECAYGKPWSKLKEVWQKCIYPDKTPYTTDRLIDAYLVNAYKNGQRNFFGGNPLKRFAQEAKIDKSSIRLLKSMYKYSKDLEDYKNILKNPLYQKAKASVNIEEMKKTIESLEEHYKNAFFKHFWTDERKSRFSKALTDEYAKFDEKVEIFNKIYEDIMREVLV